MKILVIIPFVFFLINISNCTTAPQHLDKNIPEFNLKSAMAYYSKGTFKRHSIQWQQNDSISSQTTYIDNQIGVAIETYEGDEAKVSTLSWTKPGTIEERDGFITKTKSSDQWQIVLNRSDRVPSAK